jgi:hypothetical protein
LIETGGTTAVVSPRKKKCGFGKEAVEDREPGEKACGGSTETKMQIDKINTQASMRALIVLLEGREEAARNTTVYHSCIGFNPMLVQAACQATIALGREAIVAVFDPEDVAGGPKKIGVALDMGALIRLQFGQLWMAPGAEQAVIIPRGIGRRYGHFACLDGRFVQRAGWPVNDLGRGTEQAEARLAKLTIEFALVPDECL